MGIRICTSCDYVLYLPFPKGQETREIKRIEQKQKGNKEMSRILKELIGKTPTIVGQVFGTDNWEVVDVDEEWVKLRSFDKKGKEKFKLQRIEDIQTVEFDGE